MVEEYCKMYCKNCGRELKDGVRFCDRCGKSVRQSNQTERAARLKEIEALKEERLTRKKKLADMEAEKREHKKKKQQARKLPRNNRLIYAAAFVLILLASAIISYIITDYKNQNAGYRTRDESIELNSTPVPTIQAATETASPSPSVLPTVAPEVENTDPVNSDGYREFTVDNNLKCPYPTVFIKKSAEGNTRLNLMDQTGGATLTLKEDRASGTKAAELMKEYAQTLGGTTTYSLAGDNWYGITVTKNTMVYHRKCVIDGGKSYYYDFQYDKNSVSAAEYDTYINYMDKAFSPQ